MVRICGEPYTIGERGAVSLNPIFFAGKFAHERLTLWERGEKAFYQYQENTGLWRRTSPEQIKLQLAADLKSFADEVGLPQLVNRRSNAMLADLAELVKAQTEKPGAFEQDSKTIHIKNGMLNLAKTPPELMPFSPGFYSRNICPFEFQPEADCPRFKTELLGTALGHDDIDLLQRWCGSVLLRHNAAQKILLLTGTAGGGKSTLLHILEHVIGTVNVVELRTDLLFERFELSRFVGKTLLSGKDVPGDFLSHKGASALKKLVGHDLLSPELKGANELLSIRGDFNVVCTCNSRLRVRLDADVEAWRRRILLVEYSRPKPVTPIRDFAEKLIETEGPGILLWMVQGAVLHLAELEQGGDFSLTDQQHQRVDNLLNESDSVRHFVQDRVVKHESSEITTEELIEAYFYYCDEKGWQSEPKRNVENKLPDMMLQVHRLNRRNDIRRGDNTRKGYKGVSLCPSDSPF